LQVAHTTQGDNGGKGAGTSRPINSR
jgi:hypothetical protein